MFADFTYDSDGIRFDVDSERNECISQGFFIVVFPKVLLEIVCCKAHVSVSVATGDKGAVDLRKPADDIEVGTTVRPVYVEQLSVGLSFEVAGGLNFISRSSHIFRTEPQFYTFLSQ